jgi:3-hydroxybutyryl-CoA dehydratase
MTVAVTHTYFEDTKVNQFVTSPAITVTEAHVSLYGGLTGDAGVDAGAVPELLPLCLSIGLGWRIPQPALAVLAFMAMDCQIIRPLRVGDTVRATSRIVSRRTMREGGIVIEDHEIIDQRGDVIQRGRFTFLVARRPA